MLYRTKFHTSIEINDSTNLYTQNSKKERRFRKWKYSSARTRVHGSTSGNLYTVHRTLIFIKNVRDDRVFTITCSHLGFKCIEWEGIRDKNGLHAVRLPLRGFTTHLTYKFNTERQSSRPIATTVRVTRLGVPWYNEDINKAKRLSRKAERTGLLACGTKNVELACPLIFVMRKIFDTFKTLLKTYF